MSRKKFRSVKSFLKLQQEIEGTSKKDTPGRRAILADIKEYDKTISKIKRG